MRLLSLSKKKIAAVGAGAAVLVGGGTAAAFAATSGSSSSSSHTTPAAAAPASSTSTSGGTATKHHQKRLDFLGSVGRSDYATIELQKNGSWVTETYQRGQITAVSPTSLTLKRPDGATATVSLGSGTKYRPKDSTESSLTVGETVRVVSLGNTATVVAPMKATPSGTGSTGSTSTGSTSTGSAG